MDEWVPLYDLDERIREKERYTRGSKGALEI